MGEYGAGMPLHFNLCERVSNTSSKKLLFCNKKQAERLKKLLWTSIAECGGDLYKVF